jgi:phytanoyl-CoA hydroxylase
MTTSTLSSPLTPEEMAAYHRDGFHVARAVFDAAEVAECRRFFDGVAERGEPIEGHWAPRSEPGDPLARYPRVMHPHMFDPGSRARLLDPRIHAILRQLLDDEVIACQTMFYFKPPGARGQAFHQDNYYLRVKPYSCIAAWLAIDRSTPDNGGLQVCPGTHTMEIECPEPADTGESFTNDYVPPPAGHEPIGLELAPGDVLFFTGSVVHGSPPNRTRDEWRRSFICHYLPAAATHIGGWYTPYMLDFDGNPVTRESNAWGGPCGTEDSGIAGTFH